MQDITPKSIPSAPLLRRSFQHLPGISSAMEAKLRSKGVDSWNDLLVRTPAQLELFRNRRGSLRGAVEASEEALANRDIEFFKERLPKREFYRIAASFPNRCIFLDIESTGLSQHYDQVTLVGWSTGSRYEVLVDPADTSRLETDLCSQPIVITYNGTLFDLPFLSNRFKTDLSGTTHVDLRYLAQRVGLTGGQKSIEESIGFAREEQVEGITGAEAVGLWFDYKEGDLNALRKLIRYNHADIEGMKYLFEQVVERLEPGTTSGMANGGLFERSSVHFSDKARSMVKNAVSINPYSGRVGPRLVYSDLHKQASQLDRIVVVGIDLTGSEERKSGWAEVTGQELTTGLVASDAELIARTLSAKPFLVSIDSPLSLPAGRLTEFDDDPGRQEYGIVRQAERQLRKRGINVYPALLPSMQRLTRRGVDLAARLRREGVPVIESYPGAAQDILGIPRKKTSLRHLVEGLRRFGYKSLVAESDVSHDELDAATSALVGQFMLAGYWEALGSPEEDYLIVPTVDGKASARRPKMVIGLSGPIAAGKTTAARFLERTGFSYSRFSEILEEELRSRGTAVSRSTMQALGEEVFNSRFGQRRLQNKLATRVDGAEKIVVDGLRHPEDWAFLRETWGFAAVHVYISAGEKLRRQRYTERYGGLGSSFCDASAHAVERNVSVLERLADHTVANTGRVEELEAKLSSLAARWWECR